TNGPVEGPAVLFPTIADSAAFKAWLPNARGKWVLLSAEPLTCRSDDDWARFADSAEFARMRAERKPKLDAWLANLKNAGVTSQQLPQRIEQAGALGLIVHEWMGRYGWWDEAEHHSWGVMTTDGTTTTRAPTIVVSCEDYGLVARLARAGKSPRVRVNAE